MNRIFIKYDENMSIQYIHYMPFNDVHGLGKTEQELLKEGVLIEPYEEVVAPIGQGVTYKYNPVTNGVNHEFFDIPKSQEELEKERLEEQANKISILETQQSNTEYILMMGGLI